MSHMSPSILLMDEAPEDGWDRYIPVGLLLMALFALFASERHYANHARIDAIIGSDAAIRRVEGRIDAISSASSKTVTYSYRVEGVDRSDSVRCRATSLCHFTKPGAATILIDRSGAYSLPEPLLAAATLMRQRSRHRGNLASIMSVVWLLGAGVAYLIFGRNRQRT